MSENHEKINCLNHHDSEKQMCGHNPPPARELGVPVLRQYLRRALLRHRNNEHFSTLLPYS